MRAHLVQLDLAWEDRDANYRKVEDLLNKADVARGDLVLLPEMFDTGFSMNTERTADKDGPTIAFLCELASDLGVFVQGGRTVQSCHCNQASNCAPIISPEGKLIDEYQKIHPFSLGREHEAFLGGTRVCTYLWPAGERAITVCPTICYDLRFPELYRAGLAKGAELFTVQACWLEGRHWHWKHLLIARAIENQAYVLGVNRTGRDPNANYLGGSVAVGPRGDVLGELDSKPGVLSVEIDADEVRRWREKFPAVRDIRIPFSRA